MNNHRKKSKGTDHERGYPTLQDSWVWPDRVERLFREEMNGTTLHVCCGESDLGDLTIDADPQRNPDIVADMMALPIADSSVDTVIADPPWHAIQAVGQKHTLFFELVRKVRPGGQILWNALTLPSSEQTELQDTWIRQDYEEGKISVIGRYVRYPDQITLEEVAADD